MASTRAYQIKPLEDDSAFGLSRCTISADPSYRVPPLHCGTCSDVDSTWGLSYPTFDVASLGANIKRYLDDKGDYDCIPLNLEGYRELEAKLVPLLGPNRPLLPQTALGPLQGTGEGMFSDIALLSDFADQALLVRRSVFNAMTTAGFDVAGVVSGIKYRRPRIDPLFEIEALPTARLPLKDRGEQCETCGFAKGRSQRVRLDAASYDGSIPIQRVLDCPDVIIVNEAMAQFIRDRPRSEVELEPIKFARA